MTMFYVALFLLDTWLAQYFLQQESPDKWNMLIFPSRAQMSTAFYLWTALEEILTDRLHFSSTHTIIDFVELNWCDFILCASPGCLVVCQEIIICRWCLTSSVIGG